MGPRLRANLERDAALGRLRVVDGLGAGLDVLGDAVVVGRVEGVELVQAVERDGVVGVRVAERGGPLGDRAVRDVVRGLGADEEAVAADDGVSGDGRALRDANARSVGCRSSALFTNSP